MVVVVVEVVIIDIAVFVVVVPGIVVDTVEATSG